MAGGICISISKTRNLATRGGRGLTFGMRAKVIVIVGVVLVAGTGAAGLWLQAPVDPPRLSRARKVLEACPPIVDLSVADPSRLELWQSYAPLWRDMDEPLLACGRSAADEVYRLTWWHAFTRFDPYVIRAERSGSEARVSVSVFHFVDDDPDGPRNGGGPAPAGLEAMALTPFPSVGSLLGVRRRVRGFVKRRYPNAIVDRKVRNRLSEALLRVPLSFGWCMAAPVGLFLQMLPTRQANAS